jgi:hypothetical protein
MILNEILTASEAEEQFNLKPGTVRAACTRGLLPNDYRKSGNTWLVTKNAMMKKYGLNSTTSSSSLITYDYKSLSDADYHKLENVIRNFKINAINTDNAFLDIESVKIDIICHKIEVIIKHKPNFSTLNVRRMFKAGANKALGQDFIE